MIKKIFTQLFKKDEQEVVRKKYLDLDRTIEKACNEARSEINKYREIDVPPELTPEEEKITEYHNRFNKPYGDYDPKIPPQIIISSMNENIIKYINRSTQLLKQNNNDPMPQPKSLREARKQYKDYTSRGATYHENEELRSLDTRLHTTNIVILTNNLDTNLFKQVASTLFNEYDLRTDTTKIPINKLKERVLVDYKEIYEALFKNGLEEMKATLMPLRNTAGHSDIGQKIIFEYWGNPQMIHEGEKQEAYPIIRNITEAYLKKAAKVYNALSKELLTNGVKPFMIEFYTHQLEKHALQNQEKIL